MLSQLTFKHENNHDNQNVYQINVKPISIQTRI